MLRTVLFAFILSLGFLFNSALAQENTTYHTVKQGETLFSISKNYDTSIDKIRELNNLSSNIISVGQRLIVDAGSKAESVAEEKEKKRAGKIHTVTSGQSLYSVSKKYDVTIARIKELNNLRGNTINIGQKLVISLPDSEPVLGENNEDKVEALSYSGFKRITLKGESLQGILSEYNMEEDELQLLNPSLDLSQLIRGQTINVIKSARTPRVNPYLRKLKDDDEFTFTQRIPGIESAAEQQESGATNQKEKDRPFSAKIYPVFTYPESDEGEVTTSGELLNNNSATIAHPGFSIGMPVVIKNHQTGQSTIAVVNDRITEQAVKITRRIAEEIGYERIEQHQVSVRKFDPAGN